METNNNCLLKTIIAEFILPAALAKYNLYQEHSIKDQKVEAIITSVEESSQALKYYIKMINFK